jgi:hypothetical protein
MLVGAAASGNALEVRAITVHGIARGDTFAADWGLVEPTLRSLSTD